MLSEALRLIRVFHDVKQAELAARLDLSKSYLSEIESGKKTPTLDVINKYSQEFKIPASSILFFSEQLDTDVASENRREKGRHAIASKVLSFLRFVEQKSGSHGG